MNEFNHKTVFVLDHTPYFGISCESPIDCDFIKSKIPIPPISKSLWTCAVEASVEYCRIAWDLFPAGKLIRFVVSDTAAHIVNTWNVSTQSLTHVMNAMSMVGVPPRQTQANDYSVIHGLRAAIEALAEPTDFQKEQLAGKEHTVYNLGRVICITSARDDASMKSLEDIFRTVLVQQNTISANHKEYLNIDRCHLVIINLYPANMESMVNNRGLIDISPILKSEIHSNKANRISNKLTHLILPHFDLASTTVTGIPMKEEQNASSSANYDVEIFHGSKAHSVFLGTELVLPHSIKDGSDYETVTLKWCTPRSCGSSEMQPCLAQCRVTPVDVTSRPSSCLINFLLNGRSVLLEMPKKSGGKITSHLLSAHGGEIFIHSLNTARSCLEEPPSISEGGGGRVTDYRINDFGQLMQMHRIVPLKPIPERTMDENLLKMRTKLAKNSRYWPLTLGTTVLYNVRQFVEPILVLTHKPELAEEDVLQCQKTIFQLATLEGRQESLALPNMGHRLKGNKREEQYRLLWAELELNVSSSGTSPGHKAVLKCIRDCRSRAPIEIPDKDDAAAEAHRASVIRATTDSPMSPPHTMAVVDSSVAALLAGSSRGSKKLLGSGTKSLFDILATAERTQSQKRIDFSGRLCTPQGQVAKLYPNLGMKEDSTPQGRQPDVK
ncbi:AAEL012059-PA [Aedes aegypti]|uniref:Protein asunder n=2 Tax=Aedes aegypti TaxID=7159 RepID=Q16N82_AEDAE|nr:protein asunder [Aedes aegypti]XP_021693476.1 protein asunder [Aedes aegypti]EAT35794.1 AAEL012059-PA [Aedes aegypti]